MTLPYQCIEAYSSPAGDSHGWVLFGARGSKLVCQTSEGAKSVWPIAESQVTEEVEQDHKTQERPGKRVKLSPPTEQTSNFSCLALTNDKQHLVAVTAEDKCIRVFHIDESYQLRQLSQRCMVRRPCSITMTSDDATILCADKFGDVYALPLIPSPNQEDAGDDTPESEQTQSSTQKTFVPSASLLTVHSGRNRKTLEEQLKQASKKQGKAKEPLKFKHELLLGHVSMLTDIVYTEVGSRSYILTADRDEHIRISRGPPQAHIIEGFCHAHDEFVSRLSLTKSGLLVSGGGDASLFVWDWLNYRLLERLVLRDAALDYIKAQPELASAVPEDERSFRIAVSGIWSVPYSQVKQEEILVACEGLPVLFAYKLRATHAPTAVVPLKGNALDVTFIHSSTGKCVGVVSVDNVHKPGSTTEIRDHECLSRLQCLSYQGEGQWGQEATVSGALDWFSRQAPEGDGGAAGPNGKPRDGKVLGAPDEKAVRELLYSVEHLRKRPGAED